ncbi:hypothetical protein [Oceanobacillus salinisoli]|uniref:hypothetical protein n=1 Tax=Oceanobacillus salinisoli TaxID=2678611 RepID=UPI0012E2247C|nr:hypothetical protein [Oceanobacillus salinisoli]
MLGISMLIVILIISFGNWKSYGQSKRKNYNTNDTAISQHFSAKFYIQLKGYWFFR